MKVWHSNVNVVQHAQIVQDVVHMFELVKYSENAGRRVKYVTLFDTILIDSNNNYLRLRRAISLRNFQCKIGAIWI